MRLIDADALRRRICSHMAGVIYRGDGYIPNGKDSASSYEFLRGYEEGAKQVANMVLRDENIVDAVPVVRCKDCVGYREEDGVCVAWEGFVRTDDFCSYG